jgi:hypothetical protein
VHCELFACIIFFFRFFFFFFFFSTLTREKNNNNNNNNNNNTEKTSFRESSKDKFIAAISGSAFGNESEMNKQSSIRSQLIKSIPALSNTSVMHHKTTIINPPAYEEDQIGYSHSSASQLTKMKRKPIKAAATMDNGVKTAKKRQIDSTSTTSKEDPNHVDNREKACEIKTLGSMLACYDDSDSD